MEGRTQTDANIGSKENVNADQQRSYFRRSSDQIKNLPDASTKNDSFEIHQYLKSERKPFSTVATTWLKKDTANSVLEMTSEVNVGRIDGPQSKESTTSNWNKLHGATRFSPAVRAIPLTTGAGSIDVMEMDDQGTAFGETAGGNTNDGRNEEERRVNERRLSFIPGEPKSIGEEIAPSQSAPVPVRTPNYADYSGRAGQQPRLTTRCQLVDSDIIVGVSEATSKDESKNGPRGSGLAASTAKNPSNQSPLSDGFVYGARGKRCITATAPPHLRSYYSQEDLLTSTATKQCVKEIAGVTDTMGDDASNRWRCLSSAARYHFSEGKSENTDYAVPSTSHGVASLMKSRGHFMNESVVEQAAARSNDAYNRPPPPTYNEAIGASYRLAMKPPAIGTSQESLERNGQAPMIITGLNRQSNSSGYSISPKHGSPRRACRRMENHQNPVDPKSAQLQPHHRPTTSSSPMLEQIRSACVHSKRHFRPGSPDPNNLENSDGISQFRRELMSKQPSTATHSSGTACAPRDLVTSTVLGTVDCGATRLGATCRASSPKISNGSSVTYSSRMSLGLNPLPEIHENVTVASSPATPTATTSPYLLPPVVSSRSSSWFSVPWSSLRTGVVSRLTRAMSYDSAAAASFDDENSFDIRYLSNLHRVTKLADHFEKGGVDHIGPLKLYQAQTYKRELAKICAENTGSVLAKAHHFESGSSLDSHSPTADFSHADLGNVSDRRWSLFTKNGDNHQRSNPRTKYSLEESVRCLFGAGTAKARNYDQGKKRGSRSRRTSYVMATTASPRNIMAAVAGTRDPSALYPVPQDLDIAGGHGGLNAEGDCSKRYKNTCKASNAAEASPSSPKLCPDGSEGLVQPRMQAIGLSPNEEPKLNRLQIPSPVERKHSSGSSLSVTPTPTPSPTSGAKHVRIQKFINFFSGDPQCLNRYSDGCAPGPGSSTSLSSCYTGVSSNSNQAGDGGNQRALTVSAPPTMEGPLAHKQLTSLATGARKRSTDRNWRDNWAILHGCTLYLCRERPMLEYCSESSATEQSVACYGSLDDAVIIDVESCIADIAYDYVKRKNTFRVTTQRQTEHLFQASDSQTMIRWIESLQQCSLHENQRDGISNSMALIIKRYEAQSQAVSPSVKQRRSTDAARTKASPSPLSPNFHRLVTGQCKTDGAEFSTFSCATASPNRTRSSGVHLNSNKTEKMERGDHTPGKTRKWRRVRKSGSCPVPSPHDGKTASNPDAMFGARLEDCPTSGEDDFVPLIVQLCVKVVESQGLEAVGVYRIPGNSAAVNSLIATLDTAFENANFNDSRWRDVNVVSSLLKAYFRKLPDPLLTDKLYQQFIDANRIENHAQKMKRIRSLIEKLPRSNFETLKYLVFHLKKVVFHSNVNKMEARNLALMFGPSLVRPCGDSSMTTMVTHMSDQCKIVELLINYCDWIFAPTGKSKDFPCSSPSPSLASAEASSTSVTDITRLLPKVKNTEEELERTKDNIVKSILNVRSGSRKSSKVRGHSESGGNGGSSNSSHYAVVSGASNSGNRINGHHDHPVNEIPPSSQGPYNERNIDEEIKSRRQRAGSTNASAGVPTDLNYQEGVKQENAKGYTRTVNSRPVSQHDNSESENSQSAAEELRRQRKEHIYAARRIFIVGTEGNDILQGTPPIDTVARMDSLAHHSRHLNINPRSLDVLSPETREKIRRLQTDSQLLRTKGHWQTQQLNKVASERQRIELAWEKAKKDYEQDDFLDTLAENPRGGLALMTASSTPQISVGSVDALSTSSDYSTTSSVIPGYDTFGATRRQAQLEKQLAAMSISCTGALALSDSISSDSSPNYSAVVGKSVKDDSKATPLSGVKVDDNHTFMAAVREGTNGTSAASGSRNVNIDHFEPPSFCRLTPVAAAGTSGQVIDQRENRRQDRIPSKRAVVNDSQNKLPNDQRRYVRNAENVAMTGAGVNCEGSHPPVRNSKAWYDELAGEEHVPSTLKDVRRSYTASLSKREADRNALDQNANTVKSSTQSVIIDPCSSSGDGKKTRMLTPVERGQSRISQKIKFRSKSSSADKRKDNRRHTLTDMEALKNVLFGGRTLRSQTSTKDRDTTAEAATYTDNKPNTGNSAVTSKAGKLKAWLKESFRKSSPDLCEVDCVDEGAIDSVT